MLFRKDPDGIRPFIKINGFLKDHTDRVCRRSAQYWVMRNISGPILIICSMSSVSFVMNRLYAELHS